jgi:hypothetical protein
MSINGALRIARGLRAARYALARIQADAQRGLRRTRAVRSALRS